MSRTAGATALGVMMGSTPEENVECAKARVEIC